jgi:putative endonuclease
MFYTYILQSLKDGSYYYGSAEHVIQRLDQHNHGKVRYTKGHLPYKLHYSEELPSRIEALRREKFFKSIAGYRWLRNEGIIK